MKVGRSVRHSLEALDCGAFEDALQHAYKALDMTVYRRRPQQDPRGRLATFLHEHRELYALVVGDRRTPEAAIAGLLVVAVTDPINRTEYLPRGYRLEVGGMGELTIDVSQWWARRDQLLQQLRPVRDRLGA
ncbi:hypothetical protein [Nocardia sp. NPDC020380]|uniref:hypothetical protein n=1 Tax=Nocardia sp. NPDC020380 TaxID=3364309 RepID=UPI00379B59C4